MNVVTYTVRPHIPEPLKPLEEIAGNLWLSWNYEAVMLFMRLDYDLWIESHQNATRLLGMVSQERYDALAGDDSFRAALKSCYEKFKRYKAGETWYTQSHAKTIAYFSMEYGLDVSLPIYSGGLGVLSGDHMKTSSDLGLPLVGVGLLYRQGYFAQYLNADGYQQESYPENDWYTMPVTTCRTTDGSPVRVSVQIGEATVIAQVWEVKIGRTSLYLLDTNIDENGPDVRAITATLYGGHKETRIQQEILLGIGGMRALKALGYDVTAVHMNEGHSAFLAIERIRLLVVEHKLSLHQAMEAVKQSNIFTTHTPVPAGNERFPVELIQRYFDSITGELEIPWQEFMALGRENPGDQHEHFCMTVLALKLSSYNNAVSELHGEVSRDMWKSIWPGLPSSEIPITSITNGVHPRSWLSHDVLDILDRYFGPRFYDEPTALEVWDRIDRVSDEELWRTHERRKERLVAFVRAKLRNQLSARGVGGAQLALADEVLSPYSLTISFARRFATYKRATLLFRDPDRLYRLLTDNERPVQLIFSGKAHPHDTPGKNLIKSIVHFASRPEVRSKIVFVENYDISIARYLVAGSDLWLNTPRRPMEASGTSGMKAAMNGVLNCSILDGWWAEAYDPSLGWAIGGGEAYEDEEEQDEIESKLLYDLLEREIIPAYYDRGRDRLPREWIHRMKESMRVVGKQFSSHRMLMEYAQRFYLPALANYDRLSADGFAETKRVADYLSRVRSAWGEIVVTQPPKLPDHDFYSGDQVKLSARVRLGSLAPEDVRVELYMGLYTGMGEIVEPERVPMTRSGAAGSDGAYPFEATVTCSRTGRQGVAVRVLPDFDGLAGPFIPGLVAWG